MSERAKNKGTLLYIINSIISIAFMFGFGYIEPIGSITPVGMHILGIFFGLMWGWAFVDLAWPSLLGLVALGFSGYMTMAEAFTACFGNYANVLLVFFCLVFAAYLDTTGINKNLAYWFISRKICIGRPWILTLMILVAAFVLGFTVSLFAAILMMWSIFYSICEMVGYKAGDKYVSIMIVGIIAAACLGIAPLPYKPVAAIVINGINSTLGIEMNIAKFFLVKSVMVIPTLLIYWAVARYILKPDITPLQVDRDFFAEYRNMKLNTEQKIAVIAFICFFIALFVPSFFKGDNVFLSVLSKFGTTGSIAFIIIVLCAIPYKEKRLANFNQLVKTGVNWDVIILLGVTIPIGNALSNAETGILQFTLDFFEPFLATLTPFTFVVIFMAIGLVLTQFAHNVALASIMITVLCAFSVKIGVNPETIAVLLSYVLALALGSPAGSAQSALLYGNKEWISTKDSYKYSWILIGIVFLCTIFVGYPVGNLIFA